MSERWIGAEEIARRICEAEGSATAMPRPTPEQAAVIDAPLAPALVVAGAGSGKTETMAARVVALIANGTPPERILGLTFTRKAAGELAERIRRRLRQLRRAGILPEQDLTGLGQPTISTYNAHAAQLVREYGLRLGIDPDARLLTEASRWAIAARVVEQADGMPPEVTAAADSLTRGLLALADQVRENLLDPAMVLSELEDMCQAFADAEPAGRKKVLQAQSKKIAPQLLLRRELARLLPSYARAKSEAGVIEFSDQVALAAQLAEQDDVRHAERSRFDAVMLDEYQDTSSAQLLMLKRLFGEDFAVMAVGDPHQSIYGWRGAAAGTLAAFPRDFPHQGAPSTVLTLSVAWRNDRAVLNAANRLAAPLRAGAAIELPQLLPRPGAGPGEVRCAFFRAQSEEAAALAEVLSEQWHPDAAGNHPTAAVLCRKRSQFDAVVQALQAAGLPYEIVGLGGLLHVPEVSDTVCFMSAAHDPSRGDHLVRLLTGPKYGIGAADLLALGAWARHLARPPQPDQNNQGRANDDVTLDGVDGASIVDAIDSLPPTTWSAPSGPLSDHGRARCAQLARDLRSLRLQSYLPPADQVSLAARILGLDIELQALGGRGALGNLERLQDVARTFATASPSAASIGAFLDYLDLAERQDERMEPAAFAVDSERIQVLTIHAAKGLEWDVVCIPGLTEGTLPGVGQSKVKGDDGESIAAYLSTGWASRVGGLPYHLRQDAAYLPDLEVYSGMDVAQLEEQVEQFVLTCGQHELEEDRRLAYVALTRARHLVFATGSWWHGSAKKTQEPSLFLREIADDDGVGGEEPGDGESNPDAERERVATWPLDPLGERRPSFEAAAAAVRAAAVPNPGESGELIERARLLLAERERATRARPLARPDHISASSLVSLARDPEAYARSLRRPLPAAPSRAAKRGTAFHAWAEHFLGQAALISDDFLVSADADWVPLDATLEQFKRAFENSEWVRDTDRWQLLDLERDVETPLGSLPLRARADAIFRDLHHSPRIEIVDWKTGSPPRDAAERRVVLLQLAAYRLAFSRLHGLDPADVSTALFYVGHGKVLRPEPGELPSEEELIAQASAVIGQFAEP